MKALHTQLIYKLKRIKYKSIETIFIGGGTPTTINANEYESIFKILQPYLQDNIEITTEANPNSLSKEWIKTMQGYGINRVSIGVQSFNDDKLKYLGRNHNKDIAIKSIIATQKYIDNISIDLMYNVLDNDLEILNRDLEIIKDFNLSHISLYSLTIEDKTKFKIDKIDNNESLDTTKWLFKNIEQLGFKQYEISNFGQASSHNRGYWQYKDYIGLGAGAVGFENSIRYYPYSNLDQYILDPIYTRDEYLSPQNIVTEKILLGLRSDVGIDMAILSLEQLQKVEQLLNDNLIIKSRGRVFNNNYLLSDEIALFID